MNQILTQKPATRLRERLEPQEWRRIFAMFGFIAFLHLVGALLMWRATSGHYQLSNGTLFG